MKKGLFFTGLIICAGIIFSVSSCKKDDSEKEAAEAQAQSVMTVNVAYPQVDSLTLRKTYPGYLTANNEVEIVAKVNGNLIAHPYKAGDRVKKGDILFRIDDTTYQNEVKEARASLENAKAAYDYSAKEYEAMKKALESDAVSQMEVLQAKSTMDQNAAQIRNYQAALDQAQTTLSYCTIRAPFSGRVTEWNYDTGSYISGAAAPVVLAKIYDDSSVIANIEIDNQSYMDIVNDKALDLTHMPVTFNDVTENNYTANINYMAPNVDKTTGTMILRAVIQNPKGELKSGMYLTLGVPYENVQTAIVIEDAAIGTDQLGKYVYVVNDSNQVVYTPVVTGDLVNNTMRIINKGLTKDSKYVTKALLKVRDGEKVKPVFK